MNMTTRTVTSLSAVSAASLTLPVAVALSFSMMPRSGLFASRYCRAKRGVAPWRLVFETQRGLPDALAERIRRARSVIVDQIQQMVRAYLYSRSSSHPERESAVAAEILVSTAESGARVLLSKGGTDDPWTPDELAAFVTEGLLKTWV